MTHIYADTQILEVRIMSAFLAVLYQFWIVSMWNITFICSWLKPCIMKNKQLVFVKKGLKFINISNMLSFIACHKVSSKGHSSELGIKALLPQVSLVYFLLTKLSSWLLTDNCFYDITNNVSELLAKFKMCGNIIKKTYI